METLANRTKIIGRIRQEIDAQSSGTLILRSNENHIAMLGFEEGALVSLFCEGLRGLRALPRFFRISGCTSRFDHFLPASPQPELPTTPELLALLEREIPAGEAEPAGHAEQVEEETIAAIARILTEYVGPIGPLLCRSLVGAPGGVHSVADAENMIEKLAGEILDEAQRRQFITDASRCLEEKA